MWHSSPVDEAVRRAWFLKAVSRALWPDASLRTYVEAVHPDGLDASR